MVWNRSRSEWFWIVFCALIAALGFFMIFLSFAGAQGTTPQLPPADISTENLWILVVPILISVALTCLRLLPPDFPDFGKRAIVAAVSLALAAVGLQVTKQLDFSNWLRTGLFMVFLAAGFYSLIWKPFQDGVLFKIKEEAVVVSGASKGKVMDVGN